MIVRGNTELKACYHQLRADDIFIGLLPATHVKSTLLIDLLERGIRCFPSPLSQVLTNSKVAQALVLEDWMIPHTMVIRRRPDLMDAIGVFNQIGVGPVVTKQDHLHCGYGIRKWQNIEDTYSHLGLDKDAYPFVVQPWWDKLVDVRVILVEDYREAYERCNPFNFRKNLACGGQRRPFDLDHDQVNFCRAAMRRGKFPYAHIDLLVPEEGTCRLSEISLNGGLKGAAISREELDRKKQSCLAKLAEQIGRPA